VRGTAVVGTRSGEHHALPALMAAIALRWDGWRVHHLAADIPPDDLEAFLERERPDLLVLSATMPAAATAAPRSARELGVPVLIGGPGRRLGELLTMARVFSHT
jgi:methanogenic corrinoid protein MtbC1